MSCMYCLCIGNGVWHARDNNTQCEAFTFSGARSCACKRFSNSSFQLTWVQYTHTPHTHTPTHLTAHTLSLLTSNSHLTKTTKYFFFLPSLFSHFLYFSISRMYECASSICDTLQYTMDEGTMKMYNNNKMSRCKATLIGFAVPNTING